MAKRETDGRGTMVRCLCGRLVKRGFSGQIPGHHRPGADPERPWCMDRKERREYVRCKPGECSVASDLRDEIAALRAQVARMAAMLHRAMAAEDPDEWLTDAQVLLAAPAGPERGATG